LDGSSDRSASEDLATPEAASTRTAEETSTAQLAQTNSTRELGLWLLALHSFLNLRNHPLGESERAELLQRDFAPETRVAQQTLRRCLRLLLTLRPDEIVPASNTPPTLASDDGAAKSERLAPLVEVLGDAHGLCEALLAAPRVSFHAWGSYSRLLARELAQVDAHTSLMLNARAQSLLDQQPELFTLTERLTPDALGADMHTIFARLALMLDELHFVGETLRRDAPLKQTLPLFTLVHEEARTLIDLIERRALSADELSISARTELDGVSYAVGMELCKVFAHELVGLASLRDPTIIYARIENAHGLLRDCFQQITVALAQVFDPAFDGARLFQTFHTRLEQSLVLRSDLWMLLEHVRRMEQEADQPRPLTPLLARLDAFQASSMAHLMFKDWEAFERFVHELKEGKDPTELKSALHRFGTFLEALFSQINMRAVLADHPFDYATSIE